MWKGTGNTGKVNSEPTPREVLSSKGIQPDFSHEQPSSLDYIHRKDVESDIYFVRNKSEKDYSGDCSFRVTDMFPELWDPSTGKQLRVEEFTKDYGRISLNLDLEAGASIFVVFNERNSSLPVLANKSSGIDKLLPINGSWRITFPDGWGAPQEENFDQLISWTDSDNDGIKYFSGTASYHKTITVKEEDIKNNARIELSLGEVGDVAEVYLNGISAGIL